MSRTIKTDHPPLKMTVEAGRLAPAAPYDAERLDTYRRGSTLNVFITHEKQRIDEKKWWAALNRAVKECKTPWQKSGQASEAIKLSLGIVNYSKTIGGEYMQYPKSLTELDDAELADAVRGLFDVLYGITGVDPEQWRQQVSHIRDDPDETESPEEPPPAGEGSADAAHDGTPDPSAQAAEPEAERPEVGQGGATDSASGVDEREMVNSGKPMNTDFLKAEMVKKVLDMAGDLALTPDQRLENLKALEPVWANQIVGHPGLVRQVFDTAAKVIRGELPRAKAQQFMEAL